MSIRPDLCVVIFVADVARLTHFYGELLSMQVAHSDARYAVLQADGFELVIHGYGEAEKEADSAFFVREDTCIKVCWPVASIADARARAQALGGFVKPPEFEWESNGVRACDGHDPEGNVFQVRARTA